MSKHTPGPWVADLDTYPVMVRSQSEMWNLVDEFGNKEGVAGVFVANTGDNKNNAILIAAVPDLLETLKKFSDYVRDEQMATDGAVTYSTTTINHFAFLARAAIAKATGGQQ